MGCFFLTKSPYCSSTLHPELDSLRSFSYSDLFTVQSQTQVLATTLNRVVADLSLPTLDAIKIDSQGTDLRLFMSLDSRWRDKVLALEVEPGLIDAYQGEDLFEATHQELKRAGFWLSSLDVKSVARVAPHTLPSRLTDVQRTALVRSHKQTPGWCEARYLRRIDTLDPSDQRSAILLFAFALLDQQIGFASEVLAFYRAHHGENGVTAYLEKQLEHAVNAVIAYSERVEAVKRVGRPFMRVVRWIRRTIKV